jgi:hypothetical protein
MALTLSPVQRRERRQAVKKIVIVLSMPSSELRSDSVSQGSFIRIIVLLFVRGNVNMLGLEPFLDLSDWAFGRFAELR